MIMSLLKSIGESVKSGLSSSVSGLITSGSSALIGGAINQLFANKSAKRELNNQKALMDYQAEKQLTLTRNAAAANKEGLRAAGLSTAMMDGSFSLASAPSGGSTMPSVSPSLDIAGDTQKLANAGLSDSYYQREMISNMYSPDIFERQLGEMDERIANLSANTDAQKGDFLLKQENLKRLRATYENYVQESNLNVKNLSKTLEKLGFETQISEINAKYADDEMYFRLNSLATQIAVMVSQRKLNHAEAQRAFSNIALTNEQTASLRLENQLFRDTYDAKIKEINANSQSACYQAVDKFFDKENKRFRWKWIQGEDVPERVAAENQALLDALILKPKLTEQEITNMAARTGLTRAEIKMVHARTINEYSQAAKNGTEAIGNVVRLVK